MTSYLKILIKCATVHTAWVRAVVASHFLFPQYLGIPMSLKSSVFHGFLYMSIHFHFGLPFVLLSKAPPTFLHPLQVSVSYKPLIHDSFSEWSFHSHYPIW